MATDEDADVVDVYPHRRRASDRARERAGRAAYLGDRAGLLIATSAVLAQLNLRAEAGQATRRRDEASAET
jgi:hypothetical protein